MSKSGSGYYSGTSGEGRALISEVQANGDKINPETGTAINGTENLLSYDNAAGDTFFFDYNVYIAGNGQAFNNKTLTITLTDVTVRGQNETIPNVMKAVSVDFYGAEFTAQNPVAEVNLTNHIGTLNLAGEHNTSNKTKGNQLSISKTVSIPQATTDSDGNGEAGYSVRMRAFFDGALIDNQGQQPYTVLENTTTGQTVANYTGAGHKEKYLYNNEGYVMAALSEMGSGESVEGFKYVNYTASTSTYARTADILSVEDVSLKVTFTLSD